MNNTPNTEEKPSAEPNEVGCSVLLGNVILWPADLGQSYPHSVCAAKYWQEITEKSGVSQHPSVDELKLIVAFLETPAAREYRWMDKIGQLKQYIEMGGVDVHFTE